MPRDKFAGYAPTHYEIEGTRFHTMRELHEHARRVHGFDGDAIVLHQRIARGATALTWAQLCRPVNHVQGAGTKARIAAGRDEAAAAAAAVDARKAAIAAAQQQHDDEDE